MWLRSAQDGRANAGQEAVRRGFLATRPSLTNRLTHPVEVRSFRRQARLRLIETSLRRQ